MSTHYILLSSLLCAGLGLSGCHSAPPPAEATKQEVVNFDAAQLDEATQLAKADELDKKVAEAARRLSRVERNGVTYYCKRSRQMGTNISSLQCMTEAQLRVEVETMAQVRDDMRNKMGKCTAGRAGHGGPCGAW